MKSLFGTGKNSLRSHLLFEHNKRTSNSETKIEMKYGEYITEREHNKLYYTTV